MVWRKVLSKKENKMKIRVVVPYETAGELGNILSGQTTDTIDGIIEALMEIDTNAGNEGYINRSITWCDRDATLWGDREATVEEIAIKTENDNKERIIEWQEDAIRYAEEHHEEWLRKQNG
jgi:hypothetical protein